MGQATLIVFPDSDCPARPWAYPIDFCHSNSRDESRWRIVHWRILHPGSHITLRQPLQQFRGAAFFDVCLSIENNVLGQPHRTLCVCLERDRHPRVASNILDLHVFAKVSSNQIIAVEPNPDQGNLGATIAIEGDEMSQCS